MISNKLPLKFDIVLTKPFIILWTRYLSISMTFFKGLAGLLMTLLGLAVAIQILFGGAVFGMDVIGHVSAIITALGDGGFVGSLTLLYTLFILTK